MDNAIAHISNLEPGEAWQFQAPATKPFSRYKISEVTVYTD
ncbi:FxLYD domain-containing protein [Spartinivicinus marinus]